MKTYSEIGRRVAIVRGSSSQADMAAKLGVHRNTIGLYERGERLPDAEFLLAVRRHYGVSPLWLLTGEGPIKVSELQSTASFDVERLTLALGFVEGGLRATIRAMPLRQKVELVLAAYDLLATDTCKSREDLKRQPIPPASDLGNGT
jgi:transcriptional regulator with XRE-family HTH domain